MHKFLLEGMENATVRTKLTYSHVRILSPVSFYCHRAPEGNSIHLVEPDQLDPPMPMKIPGIGYPVWTLEHQGRELIFSSQDEIRHVIELLGKKVLPHNKSLTKGDGFSNQHWLSRMHKSWMPWKTRQHVVSKLKTLLKES